MKRKKKRSEVWDSLSERSRLILSMHEDLRFYRGDYRGVWDFGFFQLSHSDIWSDGLSFVSYDFAVRRMYINIKKYEYEDQIANKIIKVVEAYDAEQRAKKLSESTMPVSNQLSSPRGRL